MDLQPLDAMGLDIDTEVHQSDRHNMIYEVNLNTFDALSYS